MKTILHKSRATGYLLFLFLLTVSFSWGQGHETFENVPTSRPGSYQDRVWTGDDEIEWNATDARTDQTINGKAILVRNGALWATISGGIGDLTLTTQRIYSGGSGDITVFVDGVDKGTIAYSDGSSTGSLIGINVEGTVTLRLETPGNGDRVAMDDLIWTSFGSGGNTGPLISNIVQAPGASEVTASDTVLVSANISDVDGVASAYLNWGTASGSLTNQILMSDLGGGEYYIDTDIPAQTIGATVYYEIVATDDSAEQLTTTSDEYSYEIVDPYPTIANIVQDPMNVFTGDDVMITADIATLGSSTITSAKLKWGTASGSLTNETDMLHFENDSYLSGVNIPAQLNGTTVYYVVEAINNHTNTTTSNEQSYTVTNPAPVITNIVQDPDAGITSETDDIMVSADITDNTGIASVELRWGTEGGTYSNIIPMSFDNVGDSYSTDEFLPAQPDGTIVYYVIAATDNDPSPETTTSPEQTYTVDDPTPFGIPYTNELRTNDDFANAEVLGFVFANANMYNPGASGYVKIDGGSITTPAIDFSAFNELTVSFRLATWGGSTEQELSVSVSNDNGANYTVLGVFYPTSTTLTTFEQAVDLTTLNGTNGRIKFEMTGGSNSIRFDNLKITGVDYEFTAGVWTPRDPSGVATSADDIYVYDGEADLTLDTSANNIMIDDGATLNIYGVLTLAGDLDNSSGGSLVFKSTATSNGELGSVGGTIDGDATVERYMSANRSYRMVSSAVTTSTSINANWQEGVNNTTTDFQSNLDPNPGYGTHITGSTTGLNGFDATISGNPSIFTVNEAAQAFEALGNTNTNTLNAGEPYLLFVRGDRGVNLTLNSSTPTETVLRATGALKTGPVSQTFEMLDVGHFAMIGNPYQSSVDMQSVLANSTNVNINYYYIYDPTQATRGSYVTIDVSQNSAVQGDGNKYLQPGQGAQVASLTAGTMIINFTEVDKAPGNHTATNATGNHSVNDMLAVQLFTTENFNNQGSVHDSFTMVFAEGNDNAVTPMDAVKPMNFDENFGRDHNGTYLSIERRAMPQEGEVFALYSSGYKNNSYTIKATVAGLEDSEMYLHDQFTGNTILLDQGDITYTFEVDQDNPMSIATDRFSIQVQSRLGVEDNSNLSGVQLYPNPLNGSSFYVNAPKLNGEEVTLSINDMLGRLVYNAEHSFTDNATRIDLPKDINSGVYLVTLSSNGETKTLRVIKQ